MEKFSNQNLKEVKDILKNGNLSITKSSNLTYDKLNIVTGSKDYRTLFLHGLISNIAEGEILTNIQNIGKTQVKTTYIIEKDIDKVVMNICDDIFAISRFSIHWKDRPNFIYIIDISDNNYNKEKYIEKLNKVISAASQLNIMIILGMQECPNKYKDFCNVLSITNNHMGYSAINGDEFKVEMVSQKYLLYIEEDNVSEDPITFETYGYRKVKDDEFSVVYARPLETTGEDVITISKKVYRYAKYYVDNNGNRAYTYIYEYEDKLIHNLLDTFKRLRMLDEDKEAIKNLIDKKKIRLTQETIDKTNKLLEAIGEDNVNKDITHKFYRIYAMNNKSKKQYVEELHENREITFTSWIEKAKGFDWKTTLFITNELIGKFDTIGKEEVK